MFYVVWRGSWHADPTNHKHDMGQGQGPTSQRSKALVMSCLLPEAKTQTRYHYTSP